MKLDDHTRALIAVGASITANCQPCLQSTMRMARESGADEQEIADAIDVGKRVRKGAASKMDAFASGLMSTIFSGVPSENGECGCEASVSIMEGKNE
jgi:AhpD family alkylhydroperoxidase